MAFSGVLRKTAQHTQILPSAWTLSSILEASSSSLSPGNTQVLLDQGRGFSCGASWSDSSCVYNMYITFLHVSHGSQKDSRVRSKTTGRGPAEGTDRTGGAWQDSQSSEGQPEQGGAVRAGWPFLPGRCWIRLGVLPTFPCRGSGVLCE